MRQAHNYNHKHNHHTYLLIFLAFLLVLAVLYFTSVDNSITGNSIFNTAAEKLKGDTIPFSAELNKPSRLDLNGNLGVIQLRGDSLSSFNAGKQKFSLENITDNYIFLSDYNGDLELDEKSVTILDGSVSRASINGFAITPNAGSDMDVSLDDNFDYRYLSVSGDAFIDYLDYNATGSLIINGKNNFRLDGEQIIIQNFEGSIEVDEETLRLYGEVSSVEIRNDFDIMIKA